MVFWRADGGGPSEGTPTVLPSSNSGCWSALPAHVERASKSRLAPGSSSFATLFA